MKITLEVKNLPEILFRALVAMIGEVGQMTADTTGCEIRLIAVIEPPKPPDPN